MTLEVALFSHLPDTDRGDALQRFATDVALLPVGTAPLLLIRNTTNALREALLFGAGDPNAVLWHRLYRDAEQLIGHISDRSALPWLRAFLSENIDLCDEVTSLVHRTSDGE